MISDIRFKEEFRCKDSIERINFSNELSGFSNMFTRDTYKENADRFVNGFITEQTPTIVKRLYFINYDSNDPICGHASMISLIN